MKGKKAKALLAMLLAVQMAASGATVAFAQGATLDVAPQPSQVLVEEQEGVVYLSDLQWTDMTTAWGEPQKDQGLDENPIQFRDGNGGHIVYEKGICIHAPSSLTYSIENMGVEAFEAVVGIHDGDNNDKKEKSSCEFVVEIDGEEAYRSDVRKMDSGPLPIHVDIPADAKTLTLITTDGGDGDKQGDHSTWADAKLLLDESILQNLKSISLQADNQMLQPGEQVPVSVSGTPGERGRRRLCPRRPGIHQRPSGGGICFSGRHRNGQRKRRGADHLRSDPGWDHPQRIAGIHRGRRSGRSRLDASLPQRLH